MPLDSTPPQLPPWDQTTSLEDAARPEDAESLEWALVRYVGQPIGQVIPLPPRGLDLGRAPENELCLSEPEVSRRHARLRLSADQQAVDLWDLGSTNGVFVNGKRVEADPDPVRLVAGRSR